MEEEQDVDCLEQRGFNGEEVAGKDLRLIEPQKLAPAAADGTALWSRQNPMTRDNGTDSCGTNMNLKLE
jgi:hypothetical protein